MGVFVLNTNYSMINVVLHKKGVYRGYMYIALWDSSALEENFGNLNPRPPPN